MKTDRFIRKWEKGRKKGKIFYVLSYCIIMGSSMLVGSVISNYLITGDFFDTFNLTSMLGGVIGGAIGGYIRWNLNEEKYSKYVNNDLHK